MFWRTPSRLRQISATFVAFAFVVILSLIGSSAQPATAAGDFSIKTGYYLGNGTTRSVTGLGFTPEVVIIKADTAAGSSVWKSSAMPSNVTTYLGVATADNTETQITLDADGFTVSAAAEVNTTNTRYTYIAFAGSDCTASGVMCVGVYTGTGTTPRTVTTGFQPDLVISKRTTAVAATFRTSAMTTNHAGFFSATANDTSGVNFQTLDATGFTVGSTNNINGGVYYYVAFKSLAGKLAVGQFTGDGVDSREITGLGFEPDFVFVKQASAIVPAFNVTETWGDYSLVTTAAASAANHIQELKADGFQVGNSTSVNALGVVSQWFAFGGAPDPAPAGDFLMHTGSYVGTAVARSIETPFAPDLVIIKGNSSDYTVFSTSISGGITHYQGIGAAGLTTAITGMDASGFTLGISGTVNTNGITYEYIAFGNATTPHEGNGAANFTIGAHTGNALTPRVIDHLGIAPNMVVASKSYTGGTASGIPWTSSSMAANTAAYFTATANVADGTVFRTLDSGGFTIGSAADTNTAGAPIVWFAFKEGARFDVGTYTGNNVASTSITGLGFQPDYLWLKAANTNIGQHRSSSPTITGANAMSFSNIVHAVNIITELLPDGFVIGNSSASNANAIVYNYAAWDGTTSTSTPSTPTNTTPANGATGQDLNVTLVGSAYSDSDNNAQTVAQWQVDDDADFATPVWTRTGGAEATIAVTSGNGTFANELSGKTELSHASTYYWRVRYSDGVFTTWSTGTSFVTNVITTPTNSSPANTATVTTLTPTLVASAFSDAQGSHTASSSQWQIDESSGFSDPLYDSEAISYGSTYAVPSATLSDLSSYYWRVRYQDSSGMWSEYSTPTRFMVSESPVAVLPVFGNTVVDQGDEVNIDVQVKLTDGTIVNGADASITIFDPDGAKIVDTADIEHIAGSSGIYRYVYTIPAENGSYLYEVTATTTEGRVGTGAANFEVRTLSADITSIKSTVETTLSNMDILIGALVVVQSAVNDAGASATSFVTGLTNATNDFYKNGTLTFTSGALDGIIRRISSYDGTSKTITLDPALPSAPANGATFTITAQSLRSEEQLVAVDSQLDTIEAKIDIIDANIDTVLADLATIESSMSTVQTTLNTVRTSQQEHFDITMSDADTVSTTGTYRTTVTVLDFESAPINAYGVPTITIYDPERVVATTSAMTFEDTGVYTFEYEMPGEAVGGTWETRVAVDPDGDGALTLSDLWTLSGAPAEVVINSITDTSIPSVSANITITNEGNSSQEYNYTWCVVSSESDPCGGDNDVYTSSAAKLLAPGAGYTTDLTATVPTAGTYWFKISVDYVSGISGASLQFTATAEGTTTTTSGSSGGSSQSVSLSTLNREISSLKSIIEADSAKLSKAINLIGNVDPNSPGFKSLLDMGSENMDSLRDVQNKVTDIRTLTSIVKQIVEGDGGVKISSFLEWGSVKFGFLITNPSDTEQTIQFKSFLPEEVRPEDVIDLDGLQIDFDPLAGAYYVHADITLPAQGSVVRKVHINDIWVFEEEELETIKKQALDMGEALEGTQYEGSGLLMANDIETAVDTILLHQDESVEPQVHILTYRENKLRLARVEQNMTKLRELVTEAEASQGVFGRLSGIQLGSTWAIIVAIILGFGMLTAVIFAMWRSQMKLTANLVGMKERSEPAPKQLPVIDIATPHRGVYQDRIDG